jgi:hypothetical protein
MKKVMVFVLAVMFIVAPVAYAGSDSSNQMGPAPNSGDGIQDGSGFDGPNGPNSPGDKNEGSKEPKPSSADGIPDGDCIPDASGLFLECERLM